MRDRFRTSMLAGAPIPLRAVVRWVLQQARRAVHGVFVGSVVLFLVAPFIVIVIGSLAGGAREYIAFPPSSFSLDWYTRIPVRYLEAFQTSLVVAAAASIFSILLGGMAA